MEPVPRGFGALRAPVPERFGVGTGGIWSRYRSGFGAGTGEELEAEPGGFGAGTGARLDRSESRYRARRERQQRERRTEGKGGSLEPVPGEGWSRRSSGTDPGQAPVPVPV